jgi:hypothetical protein
VNGTKEGCIDEFVPLDMELKNMNDESIGQKHFVRNDLVE